MAIRWAEDKNFGMRKAAIYAGALNVAARISRGVEELIAPNACAFCGDMVAARAPPVCAGCYADLPWVRPRFNLAPFVVALAPLEYSFPVDAAIKRLKFQRKLFYVPAFVRLLEAAMQELPDDVDALLPMPLHWRRQAFRGFNQAGEISRGIAKATGLPIIRNVARGRHTAYQSGLPAAQRRRNLKQAFRVKGDLDWQHVLIVDDVITTGETCRELARAILDAGVERVSAVAIARAELA